MDLTQTYHLALSLGLGLLVGFQREWAAKRLAGIRTFPLVALLGTLTAQLAAEFGGWVLAGGLVALAAIVWSGTREQARDRDPGITTEVALLVMFVIGAVVAQGHLLAAVVVSGAVAVLLHWKRPLHEFVRRVGEDETHSVMQLVLVGLVILPARAAVLAADPTKSKRIPRRTAAARSLGAKRAKSFATWLPERPPLHGGSGMAVAAKARPLDTSREHVLAAIPEPTTRVAPGRLAILYIGAPSGTCLQRARALSELGHAVVHIPSAIPRAWRLPEPIDLIYNLYRVANRIRPGPDFYGANLRALRAAARRAFDLVWVDKGLAIGPATLDRLRALLPRARFVSYSPDDMLNPAHQSPRYLKSIGRYDLHVTTKSYNVPELAQLGAKDVLFVDNAFDPATHRPIELSREDEARLATEVGFVGWFEEERADWIYRLALAGVPVTVRGPDWGRFKKSHPLLEVLDTYVGDAEYARVLCATKINLGFLRKNNRDLQTTRSVEIPACRAFMLGERTAEHLRLFEEGKQAEFFASFEELLAKCRHYLAHDLERRKIAAAGHRRCLAGYSNTQRLFGILEYVLRTPQSAVAPIEAPLRLAFAN
ncbi:MAG: glycosyltransferase family protein [Candidatus Binatia bacterium]